MNQARLDQGPQKSLSTNAKVRHSIYVRENPSIKGPKSWSDVTSEILDKVKNRPALYHKAMLPRAVDAAENL